MINRQIQINNTTCVNPLMLLLLVMMSYLPSALNAQHRCGSDDEMLFSSFTFAENYPLGSVNRPETMVDFPVKWHFVGASNGLLMADSQKVAEEFEIANEWFNQININLTRCGSINYIRDNSYINFEKRDDERLCDVHDEVDVLNVYFVPNLSDDGDGLCGYAYNLDTKQRMFMENGCAYNGSTLTHELGHVFSLIHTHSTSRGWEVVARTNCTTTGDLLCDTPADPGLGSDNVEECQYVGDERDIQRVLFTPDPTNIMSYAPKDCRTGLSPEQLMRMSDYFVIYGSDLLCTSNPTSTRTWADDIYIIKPNPVLDRLHVDGINGLAEISIYNLSGKMVQHEFIQNGNQSVMNVADLISGAYLLKIHIGNRIIHKHWIKN